MLARLLVTGLLCLSWVGDEQGVAGGGVAGGGVAGSGREPRAESGCGHHGFSAELDKLCSCQASQAECFNLTSTAGFSRLGTATTLTRLHIRHSQIKCLNLEDFSTLSGLRELKISSSGLERFCKQDHMRHKRQRVGLEHLETLDLANNRIDHINQRLWFPGLRLLNLSSNYLTNLPLTLPNHLEVLDLSHNRLSETVKKEAFKSFSSNLQFINLLGNPWICSPRLSWMYPWSLTLSMNTRLGLGDVKCRIKASEKTSPLIQVMETFHREVLPQCPKVCSCDIYHFGTSTPPSYTLKVNCSGQSLTRFPPVPPFTTILDLSNNQLSDSSFVGLDVEAHHYKNIEGLVLNNNKLATLDNKLLQLKLHRYLRVAGNQLQDLPTDISLMIQRFNTEISLGNNPWLCSCNSEINNINLLSKLADQGAVSCSQDSIPKSIIGYKIREIEPLVLCPPSDEGARRELVLQLVCGSLSVCIVIVLCKLMWDYWQYKNYGKLPWIVYKMP